MESAGIPADEGPESEAAPKRNLQLIVLVVALVFLGGSVGYLVGVKTSDTKTSAIDVGFLGDMSDHHDQAVTMALMALSRSEDPVVTGFAQDVVVFQRSELGTMSAYLAEQGATRPEYDRGRTVMGWMDMPTELASMPGMASDEKLDQLSAAEGVAFDVLFLELMAEHHAGGVHMAEYAAQNAAYPPVRDLASVMARNQTIEVREYEAHLSRLRGAPAVTSTEDMSSMGH